jgi:rare lipoprotein A
MKKLNKFYPSLIIIISFVISNACAPLPVYKPSGKIDLKTKKEDHQKKSISEHSVVTGIASYYGEGFHGKKTASGAIFDQNQMTAAHLTYPFGTRVKVINKSNNKEVIVVINDRGPFAKSRIIDLSYAAAKKIDMIRSGTAEVQIEVMEWGK